MQLAANHLLSGTESVAMIAGRVGYESEAAFSRAFKKVVGTPPSQWRKHRNSLTGKLE
jgi:AraC-like DNA-binding protein